MGQKIIIYTMHGCGKCIALKKVLENKNVDFEEINDYKMIEEKGFMSAPVLEVDDKLMEFTDAIKWVQTL